MIWRFEESFFQSHESLHCPSNWCEKSTPSIIGIDNCEEIRCSLRKTTNRCWDIDEKNWCPQQSTVNEEQSSTSVEDGRICFISIQGCGNICSDAKFLKILSLEAEEWGYKWAQKHTLVCSGSLVMSDQPRHHWLGQRVEEIIRNKPAQAYHKDTNDVRPSC